MVTGAPTTINTGSAQRVARDSSVDEKEPSAPAGNDIVDAGEVAVAAGKTHVSPLAADRQWTRTWLRFDDPAVERLLMHLTTTWLNEADPLPLTEVAADAKPMVPGWVPRFRVKALSTMKGDAPDKKRLSQLANQLADAVAERPRARSSARTSSPVRRRARPS